MKEEEGAQEEKGHEGQQCQQEAGVESTSIGWAFPSHH